MFFVALCVTIFIEVMDSTQDMAESSVFNPHSRQNRRNSIDENLVNRAAVQPDDTSETHASQERQQADNTTNPSENNPTNPSERTGWSIIMDPSNRRKKTGKRPKSKANNNDNNNNMARNPHQSVAAKASSAARTEARKKKKQKTTASQGATDSNNMEVEEGKAYGNWQEKTWSFLQRLMKLLKEKVGFEERGKQEVNYWSNLVLAFLVYNAATYYSNHSGCCAGSYSISSVSVSVCWHRHPYVPNRFKVLHKHS